MATRRIREYLAGCKIPFISITHCCAYTAQEIAESARVPGRYMAKVVVVWLDDQMAIVVVPATHVVDLIRLRRETGAEEARVAEEAEFRDRFIDCQIGTMPPFGNLFGIETLVDRRLSTARQFAFNAGTHRDVDVIDYADYARLARPRIVDVAVTPGDFETVMRTSGRSTSSTRDRSVRPSGADMPGNERASQAQCGDSIARRDGAG